MNLRRRLAGPAMAALAVTAACTLTFDRSRIADSACEGAAESASCPGGRCRAGACCEGCWDGVECLPGDQSVACGKAGAACEACGKIAPSCGSGVCQAARPVVSISAADLTSCAADAIGDVWCWGSNETMQFGRAGVLESADPVQAPALASWTEVSVSGNDYGHVCAIADDGSLWCWGDNGEGQLGIGHTDAVSEPTLVASPPNNLERWVSIATGFGFTCGVKLGGSLWCWGFTPAAGVITNESTFKTPMRVGADTDWRSVSCGEAHACALRADDSLWCWGRSDNGKLGREGENRTPGVVGTSYASAACGKEHTCAVRTDGSLWCWGSNAAGALGLGAVSAFEPVPQRVGQGFEWATASAGGAHTCAVDRSGAIFCWGSNDKGQLGLGAAGSPVSSPQRLPGDRIWSQLDAGAAHTCAVDAGGVAFCWGDGGAFQHGQPTAGSVVSPSPVPLPE